MKNVFSTLSILIAFSLWFGTCRAQDRANLSPDDAIIGHWANADRSCHYYFTRNRYLIIATSYYLPYNYNDLKSSEKRRYKRWQKRLSGKVQEYKYQILSVNDNTIRGQSHLKTDSAAFDLTADWKLELILSPDRKSLTMIRDGHGYSEVYLTYIDGKRRP